MAAVVGLLSFALETTADAQWACRPDSKHIQLLEDLLPSGASISIEGLGNLPAVVDIKTESELPGQVNLPGGKKLDARVRVESRSTIAPNGSLPTTLALGDGDELELEWLNKLLQSEPEMDQFGPNHDNGKPVARFAHNATASRWYERDGKLWSHVDYSSGKVHGDVLHSTEKGARNYAAQFDMGERDGWQVFTQDHAVVTSFSQGKPLVTYELAEGKVVGLWHHDNPNPPSNGTKALFDVAESAHQEFRKVETKMRKDVRDWIRDYRRQLAGQLSKGRRTRITARYTARQEAMAKELILQMQNQNAPRLVRPRE
jgi:hypothetical protein